MAVRSVAQTTVGAGLVAVAFAIVCEGARWLHAARNGLLPADLPAPFDSDPVIALLTAASSIATLLPGCILIARHTG